MNEHEIIIDDEYAICPHCGERSGDCWEWVTDPYNPVKVDCTGCKKTYWVKPEYSACYISSANEAALW
jgi:hypothetical protein